MATKHKLVLTLEIEDAADDAAAVVRALNDLRNIEPRLGEGWAVALTRDGDRSGANLLAKSEDGRHYKHHKVAIGVVLNEPTRGT